MGNRCSCDEFYLDTLKRPYCSINSDNLRRGPRSVALVTFFSCLPIVLLPLSAFIYVLTLLSSPLHSSPLLSSSLLFSSVRLLPSSVRLPSRSSPSDEKRNDRRRSD